MKKKSVLLAFPAVLVLALTSQVVNPIPDDSLKEASAIKWDDIRRDNITVTARVEDDIAIIRYSDGTEERIELVEDEQSYTQSSFP